MSISSSKARTIGLLRPLRDVTVTAGETATFDCELSYEDIPVEWFVGPTKMEPSDRVRFFALYFVRFSCSFVHHYLSFVPVWIFIDFIVICYDAILFQHTIG